MLSMFGYRQATRFGLQLRLPATHSMSVGSPVTARRCSVELARKRIATRRERRSEPRLSRFDGRMEFCPERKTPPPTEFPTCDRWLDAVRFWSGNRASAARARPGPAAGSPDFRGAGRREDCAALLAPGAIRANAGSA